MAAKKLKIKQEVSGKTTSFFLKPTVCQSITVLPRKSRLRIYIDGADKYYRLRELKRVLPDVVVKARMSSIF